MITISVCTDEERQAVARAVEDGSLAAALGVPFEVERVTTGPGGGAGISSSWLAIGSGGTGPAVTRGCGPGGGAGTASHSGGTAGAV